MSEVNKINLNDTLFDIEDTVARENITTMQANIANDLDACSLVAEEDKSIAGAYAVQQLNRSLGGVSQFVVDETTGKLTGYTTNIGGETVFPFDSRHFIVKDGVVQNDYTLTSPNGTSIEENYNGNGFLRLYKSGSAYCCAYLSVDVTDYNYLIITNPTIVSAQDNMFATIGDSYSTNEATGKAAGTVLSLKEYTGTKVISLISFYGSTTEIKADNIWLAK